MSLLVLGRFNKEAWGSGSIIRRLNWQRLRFTSRKIKKEEEIYRRRKLKRKTEGIPSYNEICSIINKLKLNKAAGSDNIPPELLKHGGRTQKQKSYKLILMMWNKQQLPQQWNEGIICRVYKKGDRLNCNNHRPVTLLSIAYKIQWRPLIIIADNVISRLLLSKSVVPKHSI